MCEKFIFGVDHTKHGCTVWMDWPSGKRSKARFRNTCYVAALTNAESWVWEKRQSLRQEAESRGKQIKFELPPELDRLNDRKQITLPVKLWSECEEQAKSEGDSISQWIGKVAKHYILNKAAK